MKVECEAAGRDYVATPRNVKQNMKRWMQMAARHQHVAKIQAYKQERLTIVLSIRELIEA